MKELIIFSIIVLFLGFYVNDAFADHSQITIVPASGSGAPGCEETADGCYIPSTATIDVGGTVIFSNTDSAAHTFTSGIPGTNNGVFDTSLLMVGSTFEWTPTEAGEQPYYCMVHPWMIGSIIVQGVNVEEPQTSSNFESVSLSNQGGNWFVRIIGNGAPSSTVLTFEILDSSDNLIDTHLYQSNSDGTFDTVWPVTSDLTPGTYYVSFDGIKESFVWSSENLPNPIIHPSSPCDDGCTHEGNNPDLKIFASGYIENPRDGITTISSVWTDPEGVVVYNKILQVNSQGQFNNEFDNPMYVRDMRDSGLYTTTYTYDDVVLEYSWNYLSSVYEPIIFPNDGPFTLPCSMQEKGDGVSSSSCNGEYQNGKAIAKVGINYHSGLFPITNYKAVGFFIDDEGNQGSNITVTLDKISPDESKELVFVNTQSGFVSEFKMQMLGGELQTSNIIAKGTPHIAGPVTFYWEGFNTDQNYLDLSQSNDLLSLRFYVKNTGSSSITLNCNSPSNCNYDIWDGSKSFKYSSQPFTNGQLSLNPGETKEFNILFGPNIGYGGTQFVYDSTKDYFFRINEPFGTNEILILKNTNTTDIIPATFELSFDLDGINVLDVIEDNGFTSLLFILETISPNAQISVTIPRTNFDSSGDFQVLVDGDDLPFSETKNSSTRTLTINVPIGTEEIEIFGSKLEGKVSNNFPIYGTISPEPESDYEITITTSLGSGAPGCEETADGCYLPQIARVSAGGKVIMKNTDTAAHTFTSGTPDGGPDGVFDTSLLMVNGSFEWTPKSEGTYPYFCMVHPWMMGQIIVGEGGPIPLPIKMNLSIDKSVYYFDDKLTYSGSIINGDGSVLVVEIRNPSGVLVYTDRLVPSSNGDFRKSVNLSGDNFEKTGTYSIKALYKTMSKDVSFVLRNQAIQPPINENEFGDNVEVITGPGSGAPGCEESNSCYLPFKALVNRMGTVTWINSDSAAHTITSGDPSNGPNGLFDSSLLMVGGEFSHTFTNTGVYPYFCMVHPWMIGYVVVGQDTAIPQEPKPEEKNIDLEISLDNRVLDINTVATLNISLSGNSEPQNVAISITDPRGVTKISRSVELGVNESTSIGFRIDENFKQGTYKILASTSDGNKRETDSLTFKIKSQFNSFKITSVEVTNQKGEPSDLQPGEIGFIKVITQSNKPIGSLITVNLFDSELTSIGIGSVQSTLASGESEIILSFMIPEQTSNGDAEIFVNAFTDWPSNGGTPLTKEFSIVENIQ